MSVFRNYKSGDQVPQTGVFQVFHDSHRPPHFATLTNQEAFPACNRCGQWVRYKLALDKVEPMPGYIGTDPDFQQP